MNHILVYTDFSKITSQAFEQALFIAAAKGAKITICHILSETDEKDEKEINKKLDHYLAKAKDRKVKCETCICRGDLYATATGTARRLMPDMVATGTHGSEGVDLKTFGSAIHKLVRGLPVPSLVLGKGAAIRENAYQKVLIPAGGQPSFVAGVKKAAELIGENGEIVFYAIVSKGHTLKNEAESNMKAGQNALDKLGVNWRYEEAVAAPHSVGFAAQTLEFMRSTKMEMVVIPAEVSSQNRHFGKLDKEAVLLNEDGFHVLCVNEEV